MIAYLSGKVIRQGAGYAVIETGGVGYLVFANPAFCAGLKTGQTIAVHIHQHVREDSADLYGFASVDDLLLFKLLISISGVGPKSALGILSIATAAELRDTIARGDPSLLTKVSGIGRKTAERVVLELREKVGQTAQNGALPGTAAAASGEEIDALMALGYTLVQARDALRAVDPDIKESGERIKAALKKLGK